MPATAPGTPGPDAHAEPLLKTLQALLRDLPGLFTDRVDLLSLELQRAAQALTQIVVLVVHTGWLRLVGVLWPLLPAAWRNRVSPATVNLALSVGLPLTQALLNPRRPPPLATAGPLDPSRLAGSWHELVWLPQRAARDGGGCAPRWQHTLRSDGAIDVRATCLRADGSARATRARAEPVAGSAGARWRVRGGAGLLQAWPWAGHEMAVLQIDDAAGTLLLGSRGRDRLRVRVLSRGRSLAPAHLQALQEVARQRGYDVERLQYADAT